MRVGSKRPCGIHIRDIDENSTRIVQISEERAVNFQANQAQGQIANEEGGSNGANTVRYIENYMMNSTAENTHNNNQIPLFGNEGDEGPINLALRAGVQIATHQPVMLVQIMTDLFTPNISPGTHAGLHGSSGAGNGFDIADLQLTHITQEHAIVNLSPATSTTDHVVPNLSHQLLGGNINRVMRVRNSGAYFVRRSHTQSQNEPNATVGEIQSVQTLNHMFHIQNNSYHTITYRCRSAYVRYHNIHGRRVEVVDPNQPQCHNEYNLRLELSGVPETLNSSSSLVLDWERESDIIFLSETKLFGTSMATINLQLGFPNIFSVSSCNKAGGLSLLWKDTIDLNIFYSCKHIINARISTGPGNIPWIASFFYGSPYASLKEASWNYIKNTRRVGDEPWLIIGDMNVIFKQLEKQGGEPYDLHQSNFASDLIQHEGLIDLDYSGNSFTWTNGREGKANVRQCLDRGLPIPTGLLYFRILSFSTYLVLNLITAPLCFI
ncbi:hypothetical protein IFM89_035418 [Coptis chinensis]|uniref:Endonuclease/exonuclease/phosphatase domain-containing protein n=1 Tax=Coptis chinensis TaxID=261450 RepID=A0A835LPS7_9MAGN|nr:hypothetical protein IFM89_035418 [Coptis chinensis]